MGYKYNFDLTRLPARFMKEIEALAVAGHGKDLSAESRRMATKFRLCKLYGLSPKDARALIHDLISIQIHNKTTGGGGSGNTGALLLPHCARKFMDSRCKASFDPRLSSYRCAACSSNCIVNLASALGKKCGFDTYVIPGGSCIGKILASKHYGILVGVACGDEIQIALKRISGPGIVIRGIPLLRNGCSKTTFSMKSLKAALVL